MKSNYEAKLQAEREKLDQLVDEALENGTPLSETYAIMKQSNKVNLLMREMNMDNEDSK